MVMLGGGILGAGLVTGPRGRKTKEEEKKTCYSLRVVQVGWSHDNRCAAQNISLLIQVIGITMS